MGVWKKTQCNNCAISCGLEVEVENDEIISIRPDPDSPRTAGYCCRKGRSAKNFMYSPDRLDYPMKKVGDHFERISWEQAYREIAEKTNGILEEYGPRAVGLIGGTLASEQSDGAMASYFLKGVIGSQYWYNPIGLEFLGSWWSHGKVLGDQLYFTEPDEERNEVLVFWGSNSYVSHQVRNSRELIRKFSQDPEKMVITVDPRVSETARMSDLHIMPRVGADALLIRALIGIIVQNGWQHQDYLDRYAADWQQARQWFVHFDVKRALEVCQVPYDQAVELCRILTTKKWGMHQDLGVFLNRHNTVSCYFLMVLMAVCGVLLVPGGCIVQEEFVRRGDHIDENDPKIWRTVETDRFPVLGSYPVGVIPKEIMSSHPEHLRCMFVTESNPVRSFPDSKAMSKALGSLDLLVVLDVCETETTRLADYVLPAKSSFESYAFVTFQGTYEAVGCFLKHPVIEKQIGERREGAMVWAELAEAMGRIPSIPEKVFREAKKAVKTGDRIPYFMSLVPMIVKDKHNMDILPLIIALSLGREMGSAVRSLLWAALMISPLAGSGMVEKAGIRPSSAHPLMNRIPVLKGMCLMDAAFQRVDDTPQGAVIARFDASTTIENHIVHKDKKMHLYCDEINDVIDQITPEREEEALKLPAEYPLLLSSGKHIDAGVNGVMRNPNSYRYRSPYALTIHPKDASELDLVNGQEVRITTKAGSIDAPVDITYAAKPGYVMIPHQFGFTVNGTTVGCAANEVTAAEDLDELTGNPILRYVPCRVEAI